MSRFLAIVPLVACLALAAGCGDDPTEPRPDPFVIAGAVTDASGDPVADAAILLDLDIVGPAKAASMPPATVIRLSLPAAGTVTFTILDACRADTLEHRVLELEGGVHSLVWDGTDRDGRQLTDRSMWAIITTPDTTTEQRILLARNLGDQDGDYAQWDHAYVRDHVRIQAITDADGWYTITDPCVGFGSTYEAVDEEGNSLGEMRVAWRVRAWAYHADHPAGTPSAWRDLDPGTGGTVSVILDD